MNFLIVLLNLEWEDKNDKSIEKNRRPVSNKYYLILISNKACMKNTIICCYYS